MEVCIADATYSLTAVCQSSTPAANTTRSGGRRGDIKGEALRIRPSLPFDKSNGFSALSMLQTNLHLRQGVLAAATLPSSEACAGSTISTGEPSVIESDGSITTASPVVRPEVTSTMLP